MGCVAAAGPNKSALLIPLMSSISEGQHAELGRLEPLSTPEGPAANASLSVVREVPGALGAELKQTLLPKAQHCPHWSPETGSL